jgi:TonB dependent receptor/CarboxypepD_reg-like domain/TonB-dependent Receptor Plug Domain
MQKIYSFAAFLLLSCYAFGQTGSLKGNLKDGKTAEGLIGATIRIEGTQIGAMTDIEGNFIISRVPAGVYKVVASLVGYDNYEIKAVRIEVDKTTIINASLNEANTTLNAVTVKGNRDRGSEVSVITEVRQVEQIAVGISAQQIQKTQDRDASAVVRRVPGVSIQDDRFVIVRGLNERYNTVLLNDAITPSTEVDTKAFSFDLIPASAIDRMLVFKSGSPDLPGEFGGGVIKIYTKTIPDGNTFKAGLSVGYRGNSTFQNVSSYQGSNTDFLGFDNGSRSLPINLPETRTILAGANTQPIVDVFKGLPNYYSIFKTTAMPDFRANLSLTRRMPIGDKEITTINSINYSLTSQRTGNIALNRYAFNANAGLIDSEKELSYIDDSFVQNARLGVMSNWAFIINSTNKIEFRNLYNQLGSKETVSRTGSNVNNIELNNASMTYEQKGIYSGQLNGTHTLSANSKLTWLGGFGYTNRLEPDNRRYTSSRTLGVNDDPFTINVQQSQSPSLQQATRFFSEMKEKVVSGRIDFEQKFGKKEADEKEIIKLKLGAYTEKKDRDFAARWFGLVNANNLKAAVFQTSPEKFFNQTPLAPNGLFYNEGTGYEDAYKARNELYAGYASLYLPISKKFNVSGGLRTEYNRQQLVTLKRGSGEKLDVDKPLLNLLPSINAAFNITKKTQLKAAFSQTLNRPEFRELAPFPYYDFNFDVTRIGNANLKTATIKNYDFRYEFYPSDGELISIGAFYKAFTNPIEAKILNAGSGIAFGIDNAAKAQAKGVELEIRKSLKNITSSAFISDLTVLFNASLINSDIKTGFSGQGSESRFLQGQSPYLINTGLYYNNEKKNFQANILYNVVGKRIYLVGDGIIFPTVYEMPRNVLDFNLTKSISKRLEVKIGVQDILNQSFRFINDTNNDQQITIGKDDVFRQYKRGTNATFGINYSF